MNPERLRQKLLAAARADLEAAAPGQPPLDRVPYAFEKRIMARIAGRAVQDSWAALGALLWRAVLPCCAVMLLAGVGSFTAGPRPEDLGAQLDAVLLADLDLSATETP